MDVRELEATARAIVSPGKGILAADESTGTIAKRFASIDVESTEEKRRAYRELLFTTPGIGDHISGVILYDETIRQSAADGRSFTQVLTEAGVIPGIKVDKGAKPLAGAPEETVTEGLDGLRERVAEYRELGGRFSKWRAPIPIADGLPTAYDIHVNAHALGRYAALSQEGGLTPIVEPEVLMDGDHTIERCYEVTVDVLAAVYHELHLQGVVLEGTLLKPNMVLAGKDCPTQASAEEVAEWTIRALKTAVPPAVSGIVFLSGGQTDEAATVHLDAMNKIGGTPWPLSFSYGRALQTPSLKAWRGDPANVEAAQSALLHRARMNALAAAGDWNADLEQAVPA